MSGKLQMGVNLETRLCRHNEPGKLDDLEIIKDRLMEAEQKEKDLCPTCKFDKGGSYSPMCTLCNDFDCYKKKGESND